MTEFISLLLLPPVFRGFIGMIISGFCFPIAGVMVVKLNLIPLRYMLMHGVILGGAIGLALNFPVTVVIIFTNIVLVFLMVIVSKNQSFGFSGGSAGIMVVSMALASVISHIKDVPAKDSLNLLWGSPFALSSPDLIILGALFIFLVTFALINFNNILALFFNNQVAKSMGIKVFFQYNIIVFIIAIVVALGMKLLGAFLIDALLILPVVSSAGFMQNFGKNQSIKKLFLLSSIAGGIFSFIGYLLAVAVDCPPSGIIALLSGIVFVVSGICGKLKKYINKA